MSEKYYVVAADVDLPEGSQMHVDLNGTEMLLVNDGGTIYAVSYYCSHEALPLEGGRIEHGCLYCPHHEASFKLEDGSVQSAPAWEDIETYPVKVEDGVISVAAPGLS